MELQPEFIRGNQRNYIKFPCEENVFEGYEYQMLRHNTLKSILEFQQRNQDGESFLYYEVGGMQSLDIFLQTQKLKRDTAVMLARALVRLCGELEEYALSIGNVVFSPKFIMVSQEGREIRFLYLLRAEQTEHLEIEALLECCIEYLDYKDEELTNRFYGIYESLLEQQGNFMLQKEADRLLAYLNGDETAVAQGMSVTQRMSATQGMSVTQGMQAAQGISVAKGTDWMQEISVSDPFEVSGAYTSEITQKSEVQEKEYRGLKKGIWLMVAADAVGMILWKPFNLLKLFFGIAVAVVLLALRVYMYRKEKEIQEQQAEEVQSAQYREEYEVFCNSHGIESEETQLIAVQDSGHFLLGLQDSEPQRIFFSEERKVIGKETGGAQICIATEGISRIHARIWREENEYKLEDLNSTNGTWLNGKVLPPRQACCLKEGDRICFATAEYVFR